MLVMPPPSTSTIERRSPRHPFSSRASGLFFLVDHRTASEGSGLLHVQLLLATVRAWGGPQCSASLAPAAKRKRSRVRPRCVRVSLPPRVQSLGQPPQEVPHRRKGARSARVAAV